MEGITMTRRQLLTAMAAPALAQTSQDLKLSYISQVDQTEQPYRLYVPASCQSGRRLPLVVALHGTTGNQNTFFDNPNYLHRPAKVAAERHGMLLVCPYSRGPREYRGMAEHDVFAVIEEVAKRYDLDRERVYLTGHSMGGTGAAYLALHHPDVFAAVAPLAAAYGWPAFAANAGHVPFWWIAGANDKPTFLYGSGLGVTRMRELGTPVTSDLLPGEGHYGPVKDMDRVLSWLVQYRLKKSPPSFTFVVDTPLHGQAYGARVDALQHPGRLGKVQVSSDQARKAIRLENISRMALLGDLVRPNTRTTVEVNGQQVYRGVLKPGQELALELRRERWVAHGRLAKHRRLTDYRFTPVGRAPRQLDMHGTEATLANWMTDAMRAATGADVALMNRQYYRGQPIKAGDVDMVDILHAMGVVDWNLIVTELTGRDLTEILDDNVPDPKKDAHYVKDGPDASRLVQLSGARYSFDRTVPPGKRVVTTDLQPNRTYTVALEGHVPHWITLLLAGRFGKLPYKPTEIPLTTALYGHAVRNHRLEAQVEGRVVDVSPGAGSAVGR